ncbi:class I SAM-dependent methyltransferase [Caenimonas soli]|uniref:class I SAM-dependent methyltransferase n=1 Tax=Caenimonas soli TaxID=2735555 RepID=UPI001552658D|nr:class I SAM-dependent methyltransferase [Caenimonas soli]NPC57392.1 class I SAM-dependent methyltransferase [Caenimonas soli]
MGMGLRTRLKMTISSIPLAHDLTLKLLSRESIFSRAYSSRAWGSEESGSGVGSELGATEALRAYLPGLFKRLGVEKILDAPCGDWNWMRLVDLEGIDYVGVDVVPEVIAKNQAAYAAAGVRFKVADITRDDLPSADLILCRDCWVHLSFRDAASILENFRRCGATWLLVSNSPQISENKNQLTGLSWRYLNLHQPPFNFPAGLEARKDHYDDHGFQITLWRIADLPRINA